MAETQGRAANWGAHRLRAGRGPRSLQASPAYEALLARNRTLEEQTAILRREREELQRILGDAAQVQRRFSMPRRYRRGEFEIAGESFPAQMVSGDLLSILDAGEHTLFAIGDICGKGLFAGMWFTHLTGLLRVFAACGDPAEMAAGINAHLTGLPPEPPMATLFLGRLDCGSGELTYCNAGHPAPLLARADGQVEWLTSGGPLLGALAGAEFRNGCTTLTPGETLVAFSDGVVECRNRNGEDFDAARLLAATRNARGGSASDILFSVLGATQDFAAAHPRHDDVAVMVVRRLTQAALED